MFSDITLSYHDFVIASSLLVCYIKVPFGAIHTPRILEALEGRRGLIFSLPLGELRVSSALLLYSRPFPVVSHTNYRRYHLFFLRLSFLPFPGRLLRTCIGLFVLVSWFLLW